MQHILDTYLIDSCHPQLSLKIVFHAIPLDKTLCRCCFIIVIKVSCATVWGRILVFILVTVRD